MIPQRTSKTTKTPAIELQEKFIESEKYLKFCFGFVFVFSLEKSCKAIRSF